VLSNHDYSSQNLSNCDLSSQNLSNRNLSSQNLGNCNSSSWPSPLELWNWSFYNFCDFCTKYQNCYIFVRFWIAGNCIAIFFFKYPQDSISFTSSR
jgi:hypothetical protein